MLFNNVETNFLSFEAIDWFKRDVHCNSFCPDQDNNTASMDEYEKVSYRQVGRLPQGSLVRGVVDKNDGPAAIARAAKKRKEKPSIPSKYETVLHKGPREADGFGSQGIRFRAHGNANPGAGKYHNPDSSSMLWNPEMNKGTANTKGYGGLVSKTRRFNSRNELESAQEPGPGAHNAGAVWASRDDFNKAPVTSNFARPRRYRDDPPVDLLKMPGPGAYGVEKLNRALNLNGSAARCAFRSNSSRLRKDPIDQMSMPAPGEYNVSDAANFREKFGAVKGESAWGKDKSKRGMEAMLAMGSENPGPGAYLATTALEIKARGEPVPVGGIRVLSFSERRKLARANKNGKSFGGAGHDRFGKPYLKKTIDDDPPGPGSYYRIRNREVKLVSSSWGLSKSKRGIEAQLGGSKRPPGPAFYKPSTTSRKSFMLNAGSRWV